MRIWDLHCHPEESPVPGRSFTEKVENRLQIAERVGIERLGLLVRANRNAKEVATVLDRYRDRVFGLLWMTLWNETVEANLAKLNRWVADGPMVGMKIAGTDGICSYPVYDPIFQRAGALKGLIYVHAWYQVGGDPPLAGGLQWPHESKPHEVAVLAARHPEIPFICGHMGGDWELGIRAVRAAKNVSAELAGSYPVRGQVQMAVEELGAERVIYGSDIPGRSFSSQLAKVHGAAISDQDKELIFSGNLRRMMEPMMKAKGIPMERART
jgi:uncharacterized protein